MRSQSAIFVDAGFLLAVGGTRAVGTSLRSAFKVDYESLVRGISHRAHEHCGLETLRLYWYDASRDAMFTDEHKRIGLLPDVKVRLGRISFNGDQKGVDLKLGLDLVGVARNRAASVAYLLSGDDDLAEAVEEAQDLGMKVVLLGMENPDHRLGVMSVAEHLALQVDSIVTLPDELFDTCFSTAVAASPRPTPPATGPGTTTHLVPSADDARTAPLPAPGAKPKPFPRPPAARPGLVPAHRPHRDAQLVYSLDNNGRHGTYEPSAMEVAEEVGASVATSWYGSVTQAEVNDLVADKPVLPPEVDRVLLKDCAQRIGEQKTDYQPIRRALREAFWQKLDQLI